MKSRFQKVLRIAVCAMLVAILAVTTLLGDGLRPYGFRRLDGFPSM